MLTYVRSLCCLTLVGALAIGCAATTSIEQSWQAPNARGSLTNVVALVPTQAGVLSRSAEDQLAHDLNVRGIRATPGYAVLPGQLRGNRAMTMNMIQNAGFDGIVTMRVVSAHQQIQFYPTFDVYWGATWGTPVPETIVRVEINAYSLPQNRLVWSAMSKSTDPDSVHDLINDVSQVAANRLVNTGVIARTAMR